MTKQLQDSSLEFLDDVQVYCSVLTGFKRTLIDQGWSEAAAESIVVSYVHRNSV